MEETPKSLPDNCLACLNHRQTRAFSGEEFLLGRIDVRCQLEQGKMVAVAQPKDAIVTPPEWCPLADEEQPWGNNTSLLGCVVIVIERVGKANTSPSSGAPSLILIDRANWALGILTGELVADRDGSLEFVSADPKARRAVFRQKGTA